MDIRAKRIKIRNFTMGMVEACYINSQDEDNRRFTPDEVYETFEQTEKTVKWLIESYRSPYGPFVHPVLLRTKENIGYVQACKISEGWEIGYHIAKPYTGHGYATEAVTAFLPIIMADLKITEIYGLVLEENYASHRVLEKCGFILIYQGIGKYQGEDRNLRKYLYKI